MTDSVIPNSVRLCSAYFSFLMNPNGDKNNIYIEIVSNMLDLPAKGIFSANQVHATGHFYDNKPRKLGNKQRLVTTDESESRIFISDRLSYLPVICPTDEEMESYPNVPLTLSGWWKTSDLDDDGQWDDSDDGARFGANISATSYTQSEDVLESILSAL